MTNICVNKIAEFIENIQGKLKYRVGNNGSAGIKGFYSTSVAQPDDYWIKNLMLIRLR